MARSAGILLYRLKGGSAEVLLVHPGGPYWRGRDRGAWQIPKGEIAAGENAEAVALREAQEELGIPLQGALVPLGQHRQAGGKIVEGFALEQDLDVTAVVSNRFEIEWPPGSGLCQSFPEIDAARWFSVAEAEAMMLPSQQPFLDRLADYLALRH
ncbi:NUDIX domain-containing protein [Sphingopyxis sp. OAS728]|uniref:NUDIX domain-containing protein n=1 Tax=Sphingopyxis sp. OAS728 TaxID=2663823 RepID=UPI001CEF172F|nr:NUDIX domain-containing protein [Sphingopyxis sp. OAS728]